MRNVFHIVTVTLLIISCATPPTKQELENLNYGVPPKDETVGQIYEEAVKKILLDPSSIQTRNVYPPKKFWSKHSGSLRGFWIICGEVNAKNRFGGYTGFKPEIVWFSYGQAGILTSIPGNPGCVLESPSQDIDPCGYYSNVSKFFKCK